jgi:hypothetical protein
VAPCPPVYPRLAAPPRALQLAGVGFSCLNCGQIRHFSCECPQPRQGFTPRAPPPPVGQPKVAVCPPPLRVGHANFTTLEEIPLGEEVLAGTFFLFEHLIIILFDSRASHDFLSLVCAQKANVTLYATQVLILLALPEAEWLLIIWPVKSHLSLPGECFHPPLSSWKARGSISFLV